MFIAGVFAPSRGQAMALVAPARMLIIVDETNLKHDVSFYYQPNRHVYGPYYDYAYRPFWKYRIQTYRPSVRYRCGC
jgi:hypothetical protein